MKKLLVSSIAALGLIGAPAFAADMAIKAPPPAPAPVPTWTGFYGGIQFGGGWGNETVSSSHNDPLAAFLLNGTIGGAAAPGEQPVVTSFRLNQSGLVGGIEAGYNWQLTSWLVGLETDFSASGLDDHASGTSVFTAGGVAGFFTQSINAQTTTDWYGTVRGRLGWLVTPNLLLFGTGGFAYGRVGDSANYTFNGPAGGLISVALPSSGVSINCVPNVTCFSGSASSVRTGWTAGGGAEWLLDQHWSAKIEYQFVDLGSETVRIIATPLPGFAPSSFNAAFRDRFNVVRLGLNYRY
jgi:outer membrane immunogenic protein